MKKIAILISIPVFWFNCTIAQKPAIILSEKDRYSLLRKEPDEMGIDTLRAVMLYQINFLREQENSITKKENAELFKNHKPLKPILKPLQLYEPLNKVAMKFIKYGNEHGNFDTNEGDKHFSPDAHLSEDGKTVSDRVTEAGIKFNKHVVYNHSINGVSENLVGSNGDILSLMDALMHSPGHRKNLLSPYFCFVGIGYYIGSKVVVQVFIAELE